MDWCESSIDFGHVSFDSFYVTRSIIICNRENESLDLSLSSNLDKDDESELIFSLSRSGVKLFSSLRIDGGDYCQVFIRVIFKSSASAEQRMSEPKNFEIYVNCRLVKDYQKVIPIKALCSPNQMSISPVNFLFTYPHKAPKNDNMLHLNQLDCKNDIFTVTNEYQEPLSILPLRNIQIQTLVDVDKHNSNALVHCKLKKQIIWHLYIKF